MYRVQRPTNNCHQIASKYTKSHIECQKFYFPWVIPRTSVGWGLPQTPVPDWENEKVATSAFL